MERWDDRLTIALLLATVAAALTMIVLLTTPGCGDATCTPAGQLACDGAVLEQCAADGSWQDLVDCGDVGGIAEPWACCAGMDGEPTCLPAGDCGDDGR